MSSNPPSADPVRPRRPWLWITLLVLTALAGWLRVAYVRDTELNVPIRQDAEEYTNYGYNLQRRGIYSRQDPRLEEIVPDGFRAPGLPVLLALSFEMEERGWVGRWYDAIRGILVVLSVLTVPVSFLLARRLLPVWAALTVAGLVAFSPHLVAMSGYVLTETPFAFTLTVALWLAVAAWERDHRGLWVGSGLAFGLAYLCNPTVGFVPFVLLGFLAWWRRRCAGDTENPAPRAVGLALFAAVFLLAPVGWHVRNGISVPDNVTSGGTRALSTVTHGSYPGFIHGSGEHKYYPYRDDPEQPEYSSSLGSFWRIFSQRVAERPLRYASWYLLEKPYWLWSWGILQGEGDIYIYPRGEKGSLYDQSVVAAGTRRVMRVLHPGLCLMALAAPLLLLLERREGRRWSRDRTAVLALVVLLLSYTALYVVFAPWPRYAIPLRPAFYAVALWSVVELVRAVRKRPAPAAS